jgi:DNA-binding CsgD family transcriptional regulator
MTDASGVISADFNRDGIADFAVITPGAELLVLLGMDSGLYRRSFRCRVDSPAQGLHAADLDGDGILDLAVIRPDRQGFKLLRGHGDGTFARSDGLVSARPTTWSLTPREQEVARLAAGGYTCAEIARVLGISRRTAETHIEAIRSKLELNHKRELVQLAHP